MPPCDLLSLAVWLTVGLWAKHAGEVAWPDEVVFESLGKLRTDHPGMTAEHGAWYAHVGRDCIASVQFERETVVAA